jgi:membrane fusion protein (multidrug efflux system)
VSAPEVIPAEETREPGDGQRARFDIRRLSPRSPRVVFGVIAAAIVLLSAGGWLVRQFTHVTIDDARIAVDMISISSRVPGWVTSRSVIDGDRAALGSVLVTIDSRDSRLHVQELDARLASVVSRREELRTRMEMIDQRTASAIRSEQAAVTAAAAAEVSTLAREALARTENSRAEKLAPIGAIDRAELDQSRAALETARQDVRAATANRQSARAKAAQAQADRVEIEVLARQLAALDPEERQLRAERERALIDVEDRTIRMPFLGVVDRTFVDPGEYVTPGQRLLLVHDPDQVRVEANVKETDIRFMRPGKKVRITVDALPGYAFEGTVVRVGQAATSEFALLPSPNPSGNFTKITQRLPVRIAVRQRDGLLKPGMMVEIEARR